MCQTLFGTPTESAMIPTYGMQLAGFVPSSVDLLDYVLCVDVANIART